MRRANWLGWSVFVLGLGACTSVLDIEELEEGPKPDSTTGGRGETSGGASGGSEPPADDGGSSTGGAAAATGGRSATGGSSTGGATSTSSNGGRPGMAGGSAGGAGEGGSAEASPGAVQGRVIDFWGRPVPNVAIGIGDERGATDNEGAFTLEDVTPPYDVSLVVDNGRINYAWVYQGVTRLDPTLQVEAALPERGNTTTFILQNAMFGGENVVSAAVGGPDSSYKVKPSGGELTVFPSWSGPLSVEVTAHGLWWTETDTDAIPGPASYASYAKSAGPLTFTDGMPTDVVLDLSENTVSTARVQGTVVRTLPDSPNLAAYVRFGDNAVIELFNEAADGANFVFTAPELPDATVIAVGSHGDLFSGPYGVAAEAFDGAGITITPPEPCTIISPASDAVDVGPDTVFEWTAKPGARVLHIEDTDYYKGLYVVTMATEITLPPITGFTLRANAVHTWTVETHGSAETMDDITGPDGFLDPLSDDWETPRGPKHGSPSFSFSQRRAFQTAP